MTVKLSLCLTGQTLWHEDILGSGGIAPPVLISALDGGERLDSRAPAALLDIIREKKNLVPTGNRTPAVQPVARPTELLATPSQIRQLIVVKVVINTILLANITVYNNF
jgi:hypothetical protein